MPLGANDDLETLCKRLYGTIAFMWMPLSLLDFYAIHVSQNSKVQVADTQVFISHPVLAVAAVKSATCAVATAMLPETIHCLSSMGGRLATSTCVSPLSENRLPLPTRMAIVIGVIGLK